MALEAGEPVAAKPSASQHARDNQTNPPLVRMSSFRDTGGASTRQVMSPLSDALPAGGTKSLLTAAIGRGGAPDDTAFDVKPLARYGYRCNTGRTSETVNPNATGSLHRCSGVDDHETHRRRSLVPANDTGNSADSFRRARGPGGRGAHGARVGDTCGWDAPARKCRRANATGAAARPVWRHDVCGRVVHDDHERRRHLHARQRVQLQRHCTLHRDSLEPGRERHRQLDRVQRQRL